MEIIKSKDNSIIKEYVKLSNNRKYRKNLNKFVLEGLRIVTDALNENAPISEVLISESAFEKYSEKLADLKLTNSSIIISNELALKISSTESTQGIFAICDIPKNEPIDFKKDGKYIVLYQVQDPGNVGMIIRTADALGLDGAILCQSCDFYSPKVIRSTMGSAFRVNRWVCDDIYSVLKTLKDNDIITYSATIDSPNDVRKEKFSGGCAIVVGNEGNGLPKEVSNMCDKPITIKMNGNINSLNVAMASGIIMWKMSIDHE
ncbi:MAG: TrmH family RNA methyltransferase [Oscillospiraceae bacterium]